VTGRQPLTEKQEEKRGGNVPEGVVEIWGSARGEEGKSKQKTPTTKTIEQK